MTGIGTIVNAAAIIAGVTFGMLIKGGIPERIRKMIFSCIGIGVSVIGLLGVVHNEGDSLMLIIYLVLGGILGELLDIDGKLEKLGDRLKKRFVKEGSSQAATFVEGFVSASAIFIIGAMAIVGSLNDGLIHDPSILYTKALIDGVTASVLAASLGVGVAFSVIPLVIYQGAITALAAILSPLFTDTLIRNMSFAGDVVIICIGVNFLFPKTFKPANMFPAMFLPIITELATKLFLS